MSRDAMSLMGLGPNIHNISSVRIEMVDIKASQVG